MTPQRFLFFPFLILINSYSYSQILNDSTICLNPIQVKVINLSFNQLNKMIELNDTKDSLLQLKEKRIDILKFQLDTRSNQLIEVNVDHMRLTKANKRLRFELLCWKITALVGIITTILIFK